MAELHLWDNSYLGPWIFGSVNDVVLLQSFQQQKTRPSKYKNKTTRWPHQQVEVVRQTSTEIPKQAETPKTINP